MDRDAIPIIIEHLDSLISELDADPNLQRMLSKTIEELKKALGLED